MQFTVLESKGDEKVVLKVSGASVSEVNGIRRAILSQIPCFAIDEVDFYENNSALYNEYLANRLGLVPLTFDADVADDARVSLTMNVQGPGIIYSKDLVSADGVIKPINNNFPIVDLGDNQRVRVEAWAVKGTAKKHAKFQCAHASYGLMPFFKVKKNSPKLKEFVEKLPKPMLDSKGEPVAWKCTALEKFATDNPDVAEYGLEEKDFVFTIESFNNVPATGQLRTALKVMAGHAGEIRKELK